MFLGHKCSLKEKFDFKRDEGVLDKEEKFCLLGGMISLYGGASWSFQCKNK